MGGHEQVMGGDHSIFRINRRSGIGPLGSGDTELPEFAKYDKVPHMAILWMFVAFLIGAFTRTFLEVKQVPSQASHLFGFFVTGPPFSFSF